MSEDEKKARFGYRKKRKRWIAIQTVLLVIVANIWSSDSIETDTVYTAHRRVSLR